MLSTVVHELDAGLLEVVLARRIRVRRCVKKKYACPDGHAVKTADAPAALIDRCKYEPSVSRT